MERIVIIGAGECGVRAAFALREAGYGGALTLIGEERRLPYERPPLSKTWPPAPRPIATPEVYEAAGIDLRTGVTAIALDPQSRAVTLSGGETLGFDALLIATGARPRVFPGLEQALSLRTADDAARILGGLAPGKRLAIVGGGFIGLELAATARGRGTDVVVVEAGERLMARAVPADIAAVAEARHRAEGVDIRLGATVASAGVNRLALADGSSIEADMVVAGTGAAAQTRLAEAAGLALDNGIAVDATFRTSADGIFAAGDCCSFPHRGRRLRLESWRAAQDQAAHAARAMLGDATPYAAQPWFWSDQYDLTLQVAGIPDPAHAAIRRDLGGGAVIVFGLDSTGRLQSAAGIGTGSAVARDIRLAEMLIDKKVPVDAALLGDPKVALKGLLRG
jgi:3-phenylpropionate/trans-cinnamate dioxygenase ferredoxin reductase subunit